MLARTGSHGSTVGRRVPEMRRIVEFNYASTSPVWAERRLTIPAVKLCYAAAIVVTDQHTINSCNQRERFRKGMSYAPSNWAIVNQGRQNQIAAIGIGIEYRYHCLEYRRIRYREHWRYRSKPSREILHRLFVDAMSGVPIRPKTRSGCTYRIT